MESSGALSIFLRSIKEHGYYGDGDSKSFQDVENICEGVRKLKQCGEGLVVKQKNERRSTESERWKGTEIATNAFTKLQNAAKQNSII